MGVASGPLVASGRAVRQAMGVASPASVAPSGLATSRQGAQLAVAARVAPIASAASAARVKRCLRARIASRSAPSSCALSSRSPRDRVSSFITITSILSHKTTSHTETPR
jgi:hypothetical protein